MKVTDAMRLP